MMNQPTEYETAVRLAKENMNLAAGLHPELATALYLGAIANLLLARELRETESHDSVQAS